MEESGVTKKQKKTKEKNKPRISWKNEIYVKTFLETCIQQVAEYGRSSGSLKPQSWDHVMKTLKSTHNLVVDQKQMKNHYDYLKGKYQAWCKLKNHFKNFYDSSTNTFNLSEEEWDHWTKENPKAECLKTSPLTFPDLCTQLFDGVASTSTNVRGSNSTRPRTITQPNESEPNELIVLGIEEGVINQAQGSSNPSHNISTPSTPSHASTPSFDLEERRPTKRARQSLNQSNNTRLEEEMSNALKLMVHKDSGPSVQECKDKLHDLGWGAQNSLHKMALGIFCESASYREAWMILEEDEIENWVLMVARKLGYIV